MLSYNKNTEINLYSRKFYIFSCILNLISAVFSYFTIPVHGSYIAIAGVVLFIFMALESLAPDEFTVSQYVNRYTIKILFGMVVVSTSIFSVDKDYILFIPVLLGLMYLNVNSILKSKFIQYLAPVFMTIPIFKVIISDSYDLVEYLALLFLFIGTSTLTSFLFQTNKHSLEEHERRGKMIKQIYKLMNHLTVHDVRNELQKMQVLAMDRYRKNTTLFIKTLNDFNNNIDKIVDNKLFESSESIDIKDLIEDMSHIIRRGDVCFYPSFKDNTMIYSNKNILFSTLKNFMENSIESARRKGITCQIQFIKDENQITLIDNCGGFEINKIKFGNTEKEDKDKHGIFLKTIIDPSIKNLFGFEVGIVRLEHGTKVILQFQPKELQI